MSYFDLLLNLAGLLLWICWRSTAASSLSIPAGVSLVSTLKPTEPARPIRHLFLAGLMLLLALRSFFYWHVGTAAGWLPQLHLGAITVPFRSDYLSRMFLFSFVSFAQVFVVLHLWYFFISALTGGVADTDSLQRLVRFQLGRSINWPASLKLLMPLLAGTVLWGIANPVFVQLEILPPSASFLHLLEQSIVVGLCSFLAWKLLIVVLLLLYMVNNYVYLGNYAFWNSINALAQTLLRLLAWLPLRIGKLDLSPVAGIAIVFAISEWAPRGLTKLYQALPI